MVTHDRYFLDRVVNRIVEVDQGKLYSYPGNYSEFVRLKEARQNMELATERKRKSLLRTELQCLSRGARARSTKQKAHIDRIKAMQEMQDIQAEYRYLPAELLTYVAGQIGVTEAKAFSVATFYENFSFEPKGKYIIKVCDGTACHVRKSIPVKEAFMKELGLSNKKHTTDDMMFTVETVSCLGACGLAPTCMVNEEVHAKMTPEKVVELINRLRGENG